MGHNITLILGGARSGKSRFAEKLVVESGKPRAYLATSQAFDPEMQARIEQHQTDRGQGWSTWEEPIDVVKTLQEISNKDNIILLDCLTLWITNLMMAERDITAEFKRLVDALPTLPGEIILVSNEVGQGIVPENAMARAFRDHAGRLHQDIAVAAQTVYFVTAGIAQKLK